MTFGTVEDWKLVGTRRMPGANRRQKNKATYLQKNMANVLAEEQGNEFVNVCDKKAIGKEKEETSGDSCLALFNNNPIVGTLFE